MFVPFFHCWSTDVHVNGNILHNETCEMHICQYDSSTNFVPIFWRIFRQWNKKRKLIKSIIRWDTEALCTFIKYLIFNDKIYTLIQLLLNAESTAWENVFVVFVNISTNLIFWISWLFEWMKQLKILPLHRPNSPTPTQLAWLVLLYVLYI